MTNLQIITRFSILLILSMSILVLYGKEVYSVESVTQKAQANTPPSSDIIITTIQPAQKKQSQEDAGIIIQTGRSDRQNEFQKEAGIIIQNGHSARNKGSQGNYNAMIPEEDPYMAPLRSHNPKSFNRSGNLYDEIMETVGERQGQ